MPTLQWTLVTTDVRDAVGRYFDFVGQWAWSPDQDAGRYAYLYGESDNAGLFIRYDLLTDEIVELTGYDEQVGPIFKSSFPGSGSTSATVFAPSGIRSGDLEIMVVESSDSSTTGGTPNTPSGWTKIFEETQGEGAAGVTTLTIFARLSTGSTASVTVDGVGDHLAVLRNVYYNHGVTNVSTDIIVGSGNGADTGNATFTGVTTTVNRSLVLMVLASTRDSSSATFSAWANSNLIRVAPGTSPGRVEENGTATGVGGVVGLSDGLMVTAGATGNSTATIAVSDKWRGVHLVIPPSSTALPWWKVFHSSAIYDGKIYLFAGQQGYPGRTHGLADVPDTWIYDIAGDSWDADGEPMPKNDYSGPLGAGTGEDRTGAVAHTVGNKIYVVGGFGSGSNVPVNDRTDRYDPVLDTWTQRDYMNFGADFPAVVEDGSGRLHSFGSFGTGGVMNKHDRYDPTTNVWTTLSDVTDVEHGGNLEIFQGAVIYDPDLDQIVLTVWFNTADPPVFDFTNRYNPGPNTWESATEFELFEQLDSNDIVSGGNVITQGRYGDKRFYLGHHDGISGSFTLSGIQYYVLAGGGPYWGIPLS